VRNGIYKPKEFHGRGTKIVNMGELFAYPRLRSVPMKRVELSSSELDRFTVAAGDLLFARRSLVAEGAGKCCIVLETDEPTSFESSIIRARPDSSKVEPLYLYYFFCSPIGIHYLDTIRRQVAVAGITGSDLSQLELPVPPIREQRAIAHILGTLDDKIELNRRMNETLEAIARALFTERAREEDWDEYLLGDLCTIYDGPHATPKLVEHGPIFLGISNLANGLLDLSETAHVTDEDFTKWTRRVTPSAGDVVFSYETRLGQVAIIPEGLKCCLGRRMGLLRPKDGRASGLVLLQAYLAAEFQETIRQRTIHGSTVDRIPLKEMGAFPIRLPEGEARQQLAAPLLPMRSRVEHNQRESHTLAALRDALLPKLISGALRVKDAERLVEAAA
jgi:type I restriction enzyme S subunit